jgi:hypothetical protein
MEQELEAMFGQFRALFGELKTALEGMKEGAPAFDDFKPTLTPEQIAERKAVLAQLEEANKAKLQNLEGILKRFKEIPLKKPPKPMTPHDGQTLGPSGQTPKYVVEKMLELADIHENDVLYDLGSGDGGIVLEAVRRYRIQAGGVEANPIWYKFGRERALFLKLKSYVDFLLADALTVDLSRATIVTLFLSAEGHLKLRPKLRKELRPGARIVAHTYDLGDWKPDKVVQAEDGRGNTYNIFSWRIPEAGLPPDTSSKPIWEGL